MAQPIKLLYMVDNYGSPHAGTERQLYLLVKYLHCHEVAPEMLAFKRTEYLANGEFPCKVTFLDRTKMASLNNLLRLMFRAMGYRVRGYRIVHLFFNDPALVGPLVFKLLGFSVITSRRDMGIWYTRARLRILKFNRYFTDLAIVNSHAVARVTNEKEKIPEKRIRVISNAYVTPGDIVSEQIPEHEEYIFEQAQYVIGIVANIRPIKRIGDAVRALGVIKNRYPGVRLVVIGGGDPAPLHELARQEGVENALFCLGSRSDPSIYIKRFDLALLCSESEGLSNSLVEYMLSGRPTICSDVGGNSEVIDHGHTGLLYPMGDVEELVKMICRLVEDEPFGTELGKNARNYATQKFSMDRMIDAHLAVYKGLAGVAL